MLETYLLRNGWTDLKNSFSLVPSWSGEGFRQKKTLDFRKKNRGFFRSQFRIILQNVNTNIGRSPETPDSGKAARG